MKNIKYLTPEICFVSLRSSDVITFSAIVGEDGVIQLKEYVLGGFDDEGGFDR